MNLIPPTTVTYILAVILIIWNVYNSLRTTKQGAIGEAADTIGILQADGSVKEKEIARLREENSALKATLVEKDHQIQSLTGIFQGGQTSALMDFMKNMTTAVTGFQEYIKGNNKQMEKILETLTVLLGRK
jgi:hypothetical protein